MSRLPDLDCGRDARFESLHRLTRMRESQRYGLPIYSKLVRTGALDVYDFDYGFVEVRLACIRYDDGMYAPYLAVLPYPKECCGLEAMPEQRTGKGAAVVLIKTMARRFLCNLETLPEFATLAAQLRADYGLIMSRIRD